MLSGLLGGMLGGGHGTGHGTGHSVDGSNLLGTALGKGMSLKTIETYFPKLVPEAKKRIKARVRSKGGR